MFKSCGAEARSERRVLPPSGERRWPRLPRCPEAYWGAAVGVAGLNAGSFVKAFGTGQARRPKLRLESCGETGD